ncbi:MAG: hypothetical protein ACRC62_16750 [Microcoleus sp.]
MDKIKELTPRQAAQQRYFQTEKGKAAKSRYKKSGLGRASEYNYRRNAGSRAEYMREYRAAKKLLAQQLTAENVTG